MQKELAVVLRDKLTGLPFIDLLSGLAQTVKTIDFDHDNTVKIEKRFPVGYDTIGATCQGKEIMLIPDSFRKSIIYFEDFGIITTGQLRGLTGYNASIRLVCWLNKNNLVTGGGYQNVAGRMMAAIIARLTTSNPQNIDIFQRLTVSVVRIPPQEAALFGRYTYREEDRQYLRPPFEFFGIDLSCKFYVSAKCLDVINWNIQTCT